MAVFVDISNTTHLTFSPLNEKHNILYYRARHNVNERHVQKPWFDLNPFIDKEDDKGLNIDEYRPENDTGIQPLESLAIVEDYFSEKPLMTREFKIVEFWEFLFSEKWGDGYSIRILEGRLHNLMMSIIVNLTRSQSVVQHSTVAYAKNRRQKYNIYKHSEKEPEQGLHEETLLLEFIYYGHSTKHSLETEDSSCGYPKTTTCSAITNLTPNLSSEIESSETEAALSLTYSQSVDQTSSSGVAENLSRESHRLLKKRSRMVSESGNFPKPLIDKSLSRVQEGACAFRSTMSGIPRMQTISNYSSGSEDYRRPTVHSIDLTQFACTEKVSYLGEFDLSDDSSCSSSDDSSDYGQQLYLGDRSSRSRLEELLSAEVKLKKRKETYKNSVQKWRERQEHLYEPRPLFPEFSDLDVEKYLAKDQQNTTVENQTMPDEMPDLMQFITILKRDERNEETRKRKEVRAKFNRKRVKVTKPGNERFADEVGGVTDSNACKLHCFQRDHSWRMMSGVAKRKYLMEKAGHNPEKVKEKLHKSKQKTPPVKKKKEPEMPCIYITTPSGITYLHPISRMLMKKKQHEKRQEKKATPAGSPTRRRVSLVASITPLGQELLKARRQSSAVPSSSTGSVNPGDAQVPKQKSSENRRKFPKAKLLVSGMESPDFDSDEESDGLDDNVFDSHKINVRYSLERIRKKKAQKKKKDPMNQTIYKILKKYYRMQSILKAFSGPAPARRRSSVSGSRGSITSSRGSISSLLPRARELTTRRRIKKLPTIQDEKQDKQTIEVGKLKWFSFLDAKRQLCPPCDEIEDPLFENYPMERFRENLERALDEFVVRREVVVSDYTAKASVSITFTKKYIFSKAKRSV